MSEVFPQNSSLPILLVDDEVDYQQNLAITLEENGFLPICCQTGQGAKTICLTQHINIVILSLQLPDIDGLQLLKDLRAINKNIKVIINTHNPTLEAAITAVNADTFAFIHKADKTIDEVIYQVHRAVQSYFATDNEGLEQKVKERTDELIKATRNLERQAIERQRAEAALWQTAQRFQAMIEHASDLVFILDQEAIIRYASPSIFKVLGYKSENVIGKALPELLHPEDQTKFAPLFDPQQILDHSDFANQECRIQHYDQKWHTLVMTITNLLDNPTVDGFLVNAYDITERKKVENSLRESQQQYEQLVNTIDSIVWEVDVASFQYIFVSQQAERILGYPKERWLEHDFWPNHIHPEDRDSAVEYCKKSTAKMKDHVFEYRMLAADGRIVWLRDIVTVIVENNKPVKLQGVMVDITNHKHLEEQLHHSQKMEAIGRLAGGVAHDFNNMLTVIRGYSEILLQRNLHKDDPLRRELEEIRRASQRASELTAQLLTFSRKHLFQKKVIYLNEIVLDLEKMLRRLIDETITLTTTLESNLGQFKADPNQIEQILMNLVLNARDAMLTGGHLAIETCNIDVDHEYAGRYIGLEAGPYVILRVRDSGKGMDSETISHIFEPFFTTKEQGQGTGLGLSIVYGIVQQCDGYIAVDSELNQYTQFEIFFPRIQEEIPEQGSGIRAESSSGSETILLVEDEVSVRHFASHVLQLDGYTVLEANHGQAALNIAEKSDAPIHLLITDIILPGGMNGVELARELITLHSDLKVLYMSGYSDDAIAQHGISNGIEFLQKPFTLGQLSQKTRQVLDSSKLSQRPTRVGGEIG